MTAPVLAADARILRAPVSVAGVTLVAPADTWSRVGLGFVESDVTLVAAVEEADAESGIVVLADDPAPLDAALRALAAQPSPRWQLVLPQDSAALSHVLTDELPVAMTMTGIRVDEDHQLVGIDCEAGAQPSAGPLARELLAAWLLRPSVESAHATAAEDSVEHLLGLLRRIGEQAEITAEGTAAVSKESAELAKLRKQNADLTKKYRSITKSRVGRLFLKYRGLRKKLRKIRGSHRRR